MAHRIYIVSDGTGETGDRVLRSALVQFPAADATIERHGEVREPEQLRHVVARAREHGAWILHTLVTDRLRRLMLSECRRLGVDAMDLMGPVLDRLTLALHAEPQQQPGLFEQLEEARARSIEAVDFAFRHDDGRHSDEIASAEIVLVGVSRTMKTPLCLYLAHRGWFSANVPVAPGLPLPAALLGLPPQRIFGLTMRPARLLELRRTRARYLRIDHSDYAALPRIRAELREAEALFHAHGWHVIEVTGKSIEEIAREITDLRGLQDEESRPPGPGRGRGNR